MAEKKYFIANIEKNRVLEKSIKYSFAPGFSVVQKQKNIKEIHKNIILKEKKINKILEVSSKSMDTIGVKLSAFNLSIKTKNGKEISVESIFQASKVFENGGPYEDLLLKSSKEAKKDERLKISGNIIGFKYNKNFWDNEPKTMFYDWVYINSLWFNIENRNILLDDILVYDIFTDVEFNHNKSINCQARSLALFILLYKNNILEKCLKNKEIFKEKLIYFYGIEKIKDEKVNKTYTNEKLF